MSVHLLIPARLRSTRLPEKLLRRVAGKSILQHTFDAACQAIPGNRPVVAVDDSRLADEVASFGGEHVMTDVDLPSGTDRIAQAIDRLASAGKPFEAHDVIVNVQGDEPQIDAESIRKVVQLMHSNSDADMATVATPIRVLGRFEDPSVVKIAMAWDANAGQGRALYFSRAPIPHERESAPGENLSSEPPRAWQHIGLYAYRRDFLSWFASSQPSPLETTEKLEQLRALEQGKRIYVGRVDHAAFGIDTAEDLERFESRVARSG